MQLRHATLANAVHLLGEPRLRCGDLAIGHLADQPVGFAPGLFLGLAHDEVQANAETQCPAASSGLAADRRDLFGDLRHRLAPGEVGVDLFGGEILPGIGRTTQVDRRMRLLHRALVQPTALDAIVLAGEVDRFAGQQAPEDGEEFGGLLVALAMR